MILTDYIATLLLYSFYLFSKAKLLLKKKHYQENLLKKTDDQLEAIDKLVCPNQSF